MIRVSLTPTARCDRGCRHCMFDSQPSGSAISPSLLSTLPRELKRLGPAFTHLDITGGGEPLLYPWLPQLIYRTLLATSCDVSLVTSGCKGEEDSGYKTLSVVTDAFRTWRLSPSLSYNSYNPTSETRLRFTLPLLRKISGYVFLKVAMSYQDRSSLATIDEVLVSMGYRQGPSLADFPLSQAELRRMQKMNYQHKVVDYTDRLYIRDYVSEHDDERSFPFQVVHVKPETLLFEGRADSLVSSFKEVFDHTTLERSCFQLRKRDERRLFIDHKGTIYPCCPTCPCPNPDLVLGHLGEVPLWEALSRRQDALTKMRKKTLTAMKVHSNPCGYCSE